MWRFIHPLNYNFCKFDATLAVERKCQIFFVFSNFLYPLAAWINFKELKDAKRRKVLVSVSIINFAKVRLLRIARLNVKRVTLFMNANSFIVIEAARTLQQELKQTDKSVDRRNYSTEITRKCSPFHMCSFDAKCLGTCRLFEYFQESFRNSSYTWILSVINVVEPRNIIIYTITCSYYIPALFLLWVIKLKDQAWHLSVTCFLNINLYFALFEIHNKVNIILVYNICNQL